MSIVKVNIGLLLLFLLLLLNSSSLLVPTASHQLFKRGKRGNSNRNNLFSKPFSRTRNNRDEGDKFDRISNPYNTNPNRYGKRNKDSINNSGEPLEQNRQDRFQDNFVGADETDFGNHGFGSPKNRRFSKGKRGAFAAPDAYDFLETLSKTSVLNKFSLNYPSSKFRSRPLNDDVNTATFDKQQKMNFPALDLDPKFQSELTLRVNQLSKKANSDSALHKQKRNQDLSSSEALQQFNSPPTLQTNEVFESSSNTATPCGPYGTQVHEALKRLAEEGVVGLRKLQSGNILKIPNRELKAYWKIEYEAIADMTKSKSLPILSVAPVWGMPYRMTLGTKDVTGSGSRGGQIVVAGDFNNPLIESLTDARKDLYAYCEPTKDPDCVETCLGDLRFKLVDDKVTVSIPIANKIVTYTIADAIATLDAVLRDTKGFESGKWIVSLPLMKNLKTPNLLTINFQESIKNKTQIFPVTCTGCNVLESYYYSVVNAINIIGIMNKPVELHYKPTLAAIKENKKPSVMTRIGRKLKNFFKKNGKKGGKDSSKQSDIPTDLLKEKSEVFETWFVNGCEQNEISVAIPKPFPIEQKLLYVEFTSTNKGRMYFTEDIFKGNSYDVADFIVKKQNNIPPLFQRSPSIGLAEYKFTTTHDSTGTYLQYNKRNILKLEQS